LLAKFCDLTSNSSLPGLTRQSILFAKKMMDAGSSPGMTAEYVEAEATGYLTY
jgi:hypothetical protein